MTIPSRRWFDPLVGAYLHTGEAAVEAGRRMPEGVMMAADIETPGLTTFTINCITAAWWQDGELKSILLDPRERGHCELWVEMLARCGEVLFHNCFAGSTRVATRAGVRRFEDMAGETVEVWSADKWRKAQARCYGLAPVRKVHVRPARYRTNIAHIFEATGNHRWPLVDGRLVTTDDLRPGDLIEAARVDVEPDRTSTAFIHGLIYADGALYTHQPVDEGVWGFQLRLCGEKAKWVHLFENVSYPPSADGDPVVTGKLPFNPKELPIDPDAQYIADFLEGWQLFDGNDFGENRELTTIRPDDVEWLKIHAATAGWFVTGHSTSVSKTGFKPGTLTHSVKLSRGEGSKPVQWRVTEIGPPSEPVPVYCVEVPEIERFTLAEGIYTGNSPFDVPILWHHDLIREEHLHKLGDTIIHARMAFPDNWISKKLEDLADAHLGLGEFKGGLQKAFKAAGYKNKEAGYEGMNIESPIYRMGAMIDTVATLKLEPILRDKVAHWLTDHPFTSNAPTCRDDAMALLETQQKVNRIMLRRSAVGLAVDPDYLVRYAEMVDVEKQQAVAYLAQHHDEKGPLVGGASKGGRIVKWLDAHGQLPAHWPRTKGGALSAAKDDLDLLDHPMAKAQRFLAQVEKIEQYITKVQVQYELTGRCHPQVNILGASQSGRMCIPTTHGILTQRGVLKYDEVQRGDWTLDMHGTWTQVTDVHHYPDQETVVRTGRNGVRLEATDEHRWVSSSESGGGIHVGPLDDQQRRSIYLVPVGNMYDIRGRTIDAVTDGERFAALVGMLITDGRCFVKPGKGKGDMRAFVYQSEGKFYDEFMRVIPPEAVMYDRVLKRPESTAGSHHEIRLKTRWLRPRLEQAGIVPALHLTYSPDLLTWVLGLTDRECAAFLRAAYLGDGCRATDTTQKMVAQRAAARDAIRTAAYRLGVRTNVREYPPTGWGTDDQVNVVFYATPTVGTRDLNRSVGRSDVWCVSTTTGTFTAWDDGPYLTGNSVNSPEYHQFSEKARPIIADDGQGLTSIDWSQIEPVTMALMAHDNEFLAPFERGEDLYEPIGRATGQPRKVNKVVLLAAMYGQSIGSMATEINHTKESAAQIRRQMFAAMPECAKWMGRVTSVAETHKRIITVGGRILPVGMDGQLAYKSVNHTCVTPDTPILTADLRHVPAGQISVGDDLVGFDEYSLDPTGGRGKGKRRFRTAHVERVETIRKPGVMVSAGGRTTMCSDDHLWLVRCPERQPRLQWIRADELVIGYHQLLSLGVWETDTSWEAGYLAGLYDGEGHMLCRTTGASHTGLGFAQLPGPVMDRFCATMDKLGLSYGYSPRAPHSTSPTDNVRIHGLAKMMRTVGTLRPERFTARSREIFDGAELHTLRQMEAVPVVDDVIPIGDIDVMSIATTTRTFVANGFLSHNCQGSAYDILAHTIIRMEEEGIGDHIQLAMHDEIVVDTEAAEHTQKLMEIPPPFLERWAGRTMKLRTDRNDMGHYWQKV